MNWYKYWYYTIFFICDSLMRRTGDDVDFSVGLFSVIVYLTISSIVLLVEVCIGGHLMISKTVFFLNLGLMLGIYLFNGILFWSDKRTRPEKSCYREINTVARNIFYIVLSGISIIGFHVLFIVFK